MQKIVIGPGTPDGFLADGWAAIFGTAPSAYELTVALTILGIAIVVGFAAFATWVSLRYPTRTQDWLEIGVDPLLETLFHHVSFYDDDDVEEYSDFARVNGKPPRNDEYRARYGNGFEDWTITVDGSSTRNWN